MSDKNKPLDKGYLLTQLKHFKSVILDGAYWSKDTPFPTVSQTYSPTSEEAMSGKAVFEALGQIAGGREMSDEEVNALFGR